MITQYGNSTPPNGFVSFVSNKASLLDQVVIMQTGDNEYKGLVFNPVIDKGKIYTLTRQTGGGYNSYYNITEQGTTDNSFTYTNEYYVYSNQSVGMAVDLPVYEGIQAYSLTFLTCVLCFAILFKGVLFKCFRKVKSAFF